MVIALEATKGFSLILVSDLSWGLMENVKTHGTLSAFRVFLTEDCLRCIACRFGVTVWENGRARFVSVLVRGRV